MISTLTPDDVRRLEIAFHAIDAAKEALNVLSSPTSGDSLLALYAQELGAAVSEVSAKLARLGKATDTVLLSAPPSGWDKQEFDDLKAILKVLSSIIEGR